MKSWLGALAKTLILIVLFIAFFSLLYGMVDNLANPQSLFLTVALLAQALESYPVGISLGLLFGAFIFAARVKNGPIRFATLALIGGIALWGGGTARDFLPTASSVAGEKGLPRAGRAYKGEASFLWAREFERNGGEILALDVIAADFTLPSAPRLFQLPEAPLRDEDYSLLVRGKAYPTRSPRERELFPSFAGFETAFTLSRLTKIDAEPWYVRVIAAFGFSLFASAIFSLVVSTNWPLVGFLISGAGLMTLFATDAALASPAVLSLAADVISPAFPADAAIGLLEAAVGLILGLLSLLPSQARRRM